MWKSKVFRYVEKVIKVLQSKQQEAKISKFLYSYLFYIDDNILHSKKKKVVQLNIRNKTAKEEKEKNCTLIPQNILENKFLHTERVEEERASIRRH